MDRRPPTLSVVIEEERDIDAGPGEVIAMSVWTDANNTISPVSETELSSIHITPSDQNPEITLTQADGDRLVEQPTEHQDDVALLSDLLRHAEAAAADEHRSAEASITDAGASRSSLLMGGSVVTESPSPTSRRPSPAAGTLAASGDGLLSGLLSRQTAQEVTVEVSADSARSVHAFQERMMRGRLPATGGLFHSGTIGTTGPLSFEMSDPYENVIPAVEGSAINNNYSPRFDDSGTNRLTPTTPSQRRGQNVHQGTTATSGTVGHSSLPVTTISPGRWPIRRLQTERIVPAVVRIAFPTANIPEPRDGEALQMVWAGYAREAAHFDRKMVFNWHRNVDTRLLFSGIFSAILTPFLVESYKLVGLDSESKHPGFFSAGGWKLRVNAFWFGALMVSVIAALLAIHCKQWLDGYTVDLLPPANEYHDSMHRACILRQYRFEGLRRFHVGEVIGFLPMLLYAALLLFAVGLVEFLWHLNRGIAYSVMILCGIVLIFHCYTTCLPIFTTHSPFKTPLSNMTGCFFRGLRNRDFVFKKLLQEDEMRDVTRQTERLEQACIAWLKKATKSETVYEEACRAANEHMRQLNDKRQPGPSE